MTALSEFFGLTRVVNLRERKDRLREISVELAALGMPFEAGRVELFAAERMKEAAGFPSASVRGCFLSHLEILRDARARGVASALIIEDDLEVKAEDAAKPTALMQSLGETLWDFIFLGHFRPAELSAEGYVRYDGPLQTSHFYAVHARVFDRLIEYLEQCQVRPPGDPIGGPMEYDGALTMFRAQNPDVVTLIAIPSLGGQRSSRSDIHSRAIERVPGVGAVTGLLRKLRKKLQ